jgi:hypothetical protein
MGPTADGRIKPDIVAPGCADTLRPEVAVDSITASGMGAVESWGFDTDGDAEGWYGQNDLSELSVSGGMLHTEAIGRDPHMHGPEISIPAGIVDSVDIQMSAGLATFGQFFWTTTDGDWSEERHMDFFLAGDGGISDVEIPVGAHAEWAGTVTQFRLDPAVLGLTIPEEGSTYASNCGTSLAAPAAAGVAALMLEAYFLSNPEEEWGPEPAAYRAAMVATALDLEGEVSGDNPDLGAPTVYGEGPDYGTGYGLVQAPGAVAVFGEHTSTSPRFLVQDFQSSAPPTEISFEVPADVEGLRVALAWSDPSAAPMAETILQNDLDLRLYGPDGTEHEPWFLDPTDPALDAQKGNNSVDNLEVVDVGSPAEGTWTARVSSDRMATSEQSLVLVAVVDGMPLPFPDGTVGDTGAETGVPDSGHVDTAGTASKEEPRGGCACSQSSYSQRSPFKMVFLAGLLLWARERRQAV